MEYDRDILRFPSRSKALPAQSSWTDSDDADDCSYVPGQRTPSVESDLAIGFATPPSSSSEDGTPPGSATQHRQGGPNARSRAYQRADRVLSTEQARRRPPKQPISTEKVDWRGLRTGQPSRFMRQVHKNDTLQDKRSRMKHVGGGGLGMKARMTTATTNP